MRNSVQQLLGQQYGNSKWSNYDLLLNRLQCHRNNSFNKLLPEDEDEFRDTPIFACKFASKPKEEHIVALANEEGRIAVHNCKEKTRTGATAHNNAIFDLAWQFDQMKLVTASGDHTSRLFDLNNGEIKEEKMFCGHTRSVKTVTFHKENPSVFASGGRDGNIILWDTRTDTQSFIGKADRTINNSHVIFTPRRQKGKGTPVSNVKSVTGLVFQNDYTLISCGAGDGLIKVWDLRMNYSVHRRDGLPRFTFPYSGGTAKNGFSCLSIDNAGLKLYANCLDNNIYCYDISSYNSKPIQQFSGHLNSSFYVKSCLSLDGQYLISGSSDEFAYIWNTKHTKPLVKLSGHSAEVTCVAWSPTESFDNLITCSDDMTHKLWTIGNESPLDETELKGSSEILALKYTPLKPLLKRLNEDNDTPSKRFRTPTFSSKRKAMSEIGNESKRVMSDFGPRRLFDPIVEDKDEEYAPRSPTVNLPNFVVDGCAPHLNYSPKKKKCPDWLTVLRRERELKREMQERTEEGIREAKMARLDLTPKGRKRQGESPLLKFFKVTNGAKEGGGKGILRGEFN